MKNLLLVTFALACLVFASAQSTDSSFRFESSLLTVQGHGEYLIPVNRTSLVITLFGFGPNATAAQDALMLQISGIQTSLSSRTLFNLQFGGIMYYPYYGTELGAATPTSTAGAGQGSLTGFVASTVLSFSLYANDTAFALDALLLNSNNTAYITISSRPDQLAIEEAQRRAVTLAVQDAAYKAQAALTPLGLCALNITVINIASPLSLLPDINIMSNNFGVSLGNSFGLNLDANSNLNNNNQNQNTNNNQNANNNNNLNNNNNMLNSNSQDSTFGRSIATANVWLNLFHGSCSSPNAIQDLTANFILAPPTAGSSLGSEIFGSEGIPMPSSAGSSAIELSALGSSELGSSMLGSSELGSSMLGSSELGSSMLGSSGSGSGIAQIRRRSFW